MTKQLILSIVIAIVLTSISQARSNSQDKLGHAFPVAFNEYVADEILIKFKPQVIKAHQQVGASAANQAIQVFAASNNIIADQPLNHGWHRFKLKSGQSVSAAISEIEQDKLVETIEPNYIVRAAALSTTYTPNGAFNDPLYTDGSTQWWINRTRTDQAKQANYIFQGSSDVVVAVIDTGVDLDHSEFSGRLVAGWDFVNSDAFPDDDNVWLGSVYVQGHGTHVAGMIAANINNAAGVAGSGWKNQVKIMAIKVLDATGSGSIADLAAGINLAVTNGAEVINLSLEVYLSANSTILQNAIDNAVTNGVLVVAAAGNSNRDINVSPKCYPAVYSNVFTIGATDSMDFITFYSNYSFTSGLLNCVAPGGALLEYSPGWTPDLGVTCTANTGGWSAVDGTSFAAPQASALAALLWLQDPGRTANDIKTLITDYCEPHNLESWQFQGAGRLNVLASLSIYKTPTPTATFTASKTATPSSTRSVTFTPTPTVTSTKTITPTATPSFTPTISATYTPTPSITRTGTITKTSTHTPILTYTITPSITMTSTATRTATITVTLTNSITFTATATNSITLTTSPTMTQSATLTVSPTPRDTSTITFTPTASISPTVTMTPTLRIAAPDLARVVSFPNPWRADEAQGLERMVFTNLPINATLAIYTIHGRMVKMIKPGTYDDQGRTNHPGATGRIEWGLANSNGLSVSSGIYIYIVKDEAGNQTSGKLAIIR